jgi:hypothetical protein
MDDRERQLESEGAARRRVGVLAIVSGVLYLAGEVVLGVLVTAKTPSIGLVQGLAPALRGQAAARVDPRTIELSFLDHHAVESIVLSVVIAIGLAAMRWPLVYLRDADVARGGKPAKVTAALANYVPGLLGICGVALAVSLAIGAHDYLAHAARDSAAVKAATGGALRFALAIVCYVLAPLALAVTFVFISMRAMRDGLLTRVMGWLGAIAGVLFIIQLVPAPALQFIWLVGFGLMLLQVAGQQLPPAWAAGEAIPWASRQPQQRRARGAGPAFGRRAGRAPMPAPAPRVPATVSGGSAKKRKRRRR